MSVIITSEVLIRTVVVGIMCPLLLYGVDRTILFHASLFHSQFSGAKPDALFRTRPRVLTNPIKLAVLVVTTAAFCITILTDSNSAGAIATSIVGALAYSALSLFETLRALKKLQEGAEL